MKASGPRLGVLTLVVGVAVYAALAVSSLRQKSTTFDELVHMSAAWTHLALGDYRMSPEHPPLVKKLAALPLLTRFTPALSVFEERFSRYCVWPEDLQPTQRPAGLQRGE